VLLSTVRISVAERDRHDVIRILRILGGHATARGCLAFHVSQDVADANVLTVTERWATREALGAHVRSADYRLLLAVVDMATASPEICFDVADHIGGLDFIRTMRWDRATEMTE